MSPAEPEPHMRTCVWWTGHFEGEDGDGGVDFMV